jgi:hypothetical protein
MTIESLNGTVQSHIGTKEHWRRFESFQGSQLYAVIVADLQRYLECKHIDSSIAGSEILGRIASTSPHLLDQYSQDDAGRLFGMTLWNLLANDPNRWSFYSKKADPIENVAGTIYFRPGG